MIGLARATGLARAIITAITTMVIAMIGRWNKTVSGAIMSADTAGRVIKRALRLIHVIEGGEEPERHQYDDGIEALNDMLRSWAAEGLLSTEERYGEIYTVPGKVKYDLGGSSFPVRPVSLKRLRLRIGCVDYPVEMYGPREYLDLPYKNGGYSGRPIGAQYEQRAGIGILRIWPCPEARYRVSFLYDQGATLVGNPEDDVPVPDHWGEAVKYGLAVRLAPDYGMEVPSLVLSQAEDLKMKMRGASISIDQVEFYAGDKDGYDYR